jgi:hypothetical protein
MMDESNTLEYYRARAECARRLEQRAVSKAIGAIHAQMAEAYEERVRRSQIVRALNERDPVVVTLPPFR